MKPLARWIIGPANKIAYQCLWLSIAKFRCLYKDQFHLVICHNNLTHEQFDLLPHNLVDEVLDQKQLKSLLVCNPPIDYSPSWKFYPPRLSMTSHEIRIDNDLVLYNKPKEIDEFLDSDKHFLVTRSIARSYSKLGKLVKDGFNINTGIVGLPPGFDFAGQLNQIITSWENFFDEQTITAVILQSKSCIILDLKTIAVAYCDLPFFKGTCGTHFVGLNRGFLEYWNQFLLGKML